MLRIIPNFPPPSILLSLDGVTNGEVPQELHAEVAAAFDHLFRIAPDGEVAWKRAMSIAKSGGKFVWDFYKLGLGYALQRNNTFSIKHTGPDIDHRRRPMLHYVVVKKSRK